MVAPSRKGRQDSQLVETKAKPNSIQHIRIRTLRSIEIDNESGRFRVPRTRICHSPTKDLIVRHIADSNEDIKDQIVPHEECG